MTRKTVYVTGLGAVSCLGTGVAPFWEALCAGRCGLGPITRFDLQKNPYGVSGEVKGFDLVPFAECGLSAGGQFASEAAAVALDGFPHELLSSVALILATNFGPAEVFERELAAAAPGRAWCDYRLADGFFAEDARRVADRLGAGGLLVSISLSCASGGAAIACALDLIRAGRADAALACGYDSVQRTSWAGLSALRVMALPGDGEPAVVRPFDVDRAGTIFSEGAGSLLLESAESAAGRGVAALAEVAGAATNNNAYHMTHAEESGQGTSAVIRLALQDAGILPDGVNGIYAHGTGTKLNDVTEARAFQAVFGERVAHIPVVSIKGALGHAMGAASALEAVAAVMTLREGIVPPTVNLRKLDPECPLDVVYGAPRRADVTTVLSNSAGIGGANAAVILRRLAPSPHRQ